MANSGIVMRLRDQNAAALDAIVDYAYIETRIVVNIIESLREVGGDLHSGGPRGQHCEIGVVFVSQTGGEARAVNEFVDQEDVVAGDGGAEELDDGGVVATAEHGESLLQFWGFEFAAELALENDDVFAAEVAAPGRGGRGGAEALGEEVVGGGADFGEVVEVWVFGEGESEAGERGLA